MFTADNYVSIHTPVWGVTAAPARRWCSPASFNPHARVGRDAIVGLFRLRQTVSIHTPVWGVTRARIENIEADTVSIHTPVWGVTNFRPVLNTKAVFQSTRPCGA